MSLNENSCCGFQLKYVSLVVLCVQNSTLAILMRLARVGSDEHFNPSTAVIMSELFKVMTSIILTIRDKRQSGNTSKTTKILYDIVGDKTEMVRISIPATLYLIQNNLQYISIANLDAATFQVLYQIKILTTALFSITLLGKKIICMQWVAIVLLMCGVAMVETQGNNDNTTSNENQNMIIGLISVLLACCCSGFAGVYFEKILKKSSGKSSIWERNIQMGCISGTFGIISLYMKDYEWVMQHGFFYGYRPIVWMAISVNAFGGLLTAVVVKYADNIMKAFATSVAIILSCIISFYLFNFVPTVQFGYGAILVNIAVYIYGSSPGWNKKSIPDAKEIIKSVEKAEEHEINSLIESNQVASKA